MPCSKLRCEEVTPLLGRRSVLAGVATLVCLAPLSKATAGAETRLADLVKPDGRPSELARAMSGQMVTLRGYLAPSLDGIEFALSESSPGVCQLCGSIHEPGATVTLRTSAPSRSLPILELVQVKGRLILAAETTLVTVSDAEVQPL